ncbi:hypothetical protein PG993_006793 [Apiospora rasikravindrae]|uniref:Methyltransferase type 11 domain-containing protein n=1 Tax=Apiospora rasikravindrae TaxID=990691 RepID=A0ABR1T6Q6_9PEZI
MEEESALPRATQPVRDDHKLQAQSSSEKIVQWLSPRPRSEHFPTPRGFHFLSAPILPSSPSTNSVDESNSPSSSTNPWNRQSTSTDVTEFDDIYDVSDDEGFQRMPSRRSSMKRRSSVRNSLTRRAAPTPTAHRVLPKLTIPASQEQNAEPYSGRPEFKKLLTPVPPTPPAKVEMSPAVISFLQSHQSRDVPAGSAPPSLDGSLSSEQMAAITDWSGVQLQPGALATLRALSGGSDVAEEEYQHEQVIEIPEEPAREMEQQTPRLFSSLQRRPSLRLSTGQQQSLNNNLATLEIPSPGGFFSGLTPRSRTAWHMPSTAPDDIAPPTSTTAEQFYRCPWNDQPAPEMPAMPQFFSRALPPPPPRPQRFSDSQAPSVPIEQVVEVRATLSDGIPTARPVILEHVVEARSNTSDGLLTARRVPGRRNPSASSAAAAEPTSPHEGDATEIVTVYDPEYAKKQQAEALSNLDRTELWLMAQKAYMKGVQLEDKSDSRDAVEPAAERLQVTTPLKAKFPEPESSPEASHKKRLSDFRRSCPKPISQSLCLLKLLVKSLLTTVPSKASSSAAAQRLSLREEHRNQLLGKYQLSVLPQSAKKRMSANVARGDDIIEDDLERLKREKEAEALSQMAAANWHVNAFKALNGGRLFCAPLSKRLARLSRMGGPAERARILDLGGQATCDWAWHCAFMYPSAKVYTTTTKAIRQLSNSNIRGPPNHRQVAVQRLAKLPFPDNYFDLISARELHSILKFVGENGEDEWETCLQEAMRVLKPGGYLEFSVLDSDIVNAGPLGLAKSVEFGFGLKTLGYDPNPTKLFLSRLQRAGYKDIRRAWMCLPMGQKEPVDHSIVRDSFGCEIKLQLEAQVQGSTENIASLTGLAGSWAWERWLLRCEMEKVVCEGRLLETSEIREAGQCLDGVHAVIEEGRQRGAAWRVLNGYAMKPKAEKKPVHIALVPQRR